MSANVMDALECENAELHEEALQLRRENKALRGELSNLKRVRRQWAKDFATIESQVREGQRSLERYAELVQQPTSTERVMAEGEALTSDETGRHAVVASASPAASPLPPFFEESEKDRLIALLGRTCEDLRQQLHTARAAASPHTASPPPASTPPPAAHALSPAPADAPSQLSLEGLLVENARLREALARSQSSPPPPSAQNDKTPASAAPTDSPVALDASPDAPANTAAWEAGETRTLLAAAEREVLALSVQNEELLRDVRHYMWLASTRLVSTADDAAHMAALPAAEDALRELAHQSHAVTQLTTVARRLEDERDSLQEALDRALSLPPRGLAPAAVTRAGTVPFLDVVEGEAEAILQELLEFCGDVAQVQENSPLTTLWRAASAHGSSVQPALLPSLPDPQYAGTAVDHLIGVLRGIGYVSRHYMEQLRATL